MNIRFVSLIVLPISFLIFGGCSTTTMSNLFPPAYALSIINNTKDAVLDIEVNGNTQCKGLNPGQTHMYELWSFRSGDLIAVVAKGYHNGVYAGVVTTTIYLPYQNHQSAVWVIQGFDRPVMTEERVSVVSQGI